MSEIRKGTILSYITIFLTNSIGLVLTPYIINKLGDSEYGLYTLIGALVGYISVLDFGLNNTIIRFVAKYRAEKNKKGEENFLAVTMLIYSLISLVVLIVGCFMYFNLDTFFKDSLTENELYRAKIMFIILIFNLTITLPGGAFAAICSGYERFVFPRTINIARYITRSLAVVALLFIGGGAISLVVLDTMMNLLVISLNCYYVFKKIGVKFKMHSLESKVFKAIFSYSIWVFIFALVGQFQWKASQIVLGSITSTTMVGIYAVGIMLGTYYGAFSTAISGVFLPRATKMIVENATGYDLTMMMVRIGRISFLVLLLILGGFILFGNQFINLWVGKNYKESWLIALIIMCVYTLPLVQAFGNLILEAKSKFRFKAIVYISFIIIGLIIGSYLVPIYGLKGMVIGTSSGWLISIVIMNIYYQRVINLSIPLFFKELLKFILPTFLAIMIFGYLLNMLPGNGWLNLILKVILFFILYCLSMFMFGIKQNEKEVFKNTLSPIKDKLCLK